MLADWYRVVCADGSIAGEFSDLCDAERQVDVLEGAGDADAIIQRRAVHDPKKWLHVAY